jgi:hypothetical protein
MKKKALKHYSMRVQAQEQIIDFLENREKPTFFAKKEAVWKRPMPSEELDKATKKTMLAWMQGKEPCRKVHDCLMTYTWDLWALGSVFSYRGGILSMPLRRWAKVDEEFMEPLFGFYSDLDGLENVYTEDLIGLALGCPDRDLAREIYSYLTDKSRNLLGDNYEISGLYRLVKEVGALVDNLAELETYPDLDLQLLQTYFFQKAKKCKGRVQEPIPCQPSWVSDEAWVLYQETKPWKAANLLNDCVQDVVDYANGRVIVCLARDFLWLYALLVERGVPAYLAICSRLNIGDLETLEVIQKDLGANGVSLDNCLFVDSQGRGSIYDWMRSEWSLPAENFAFLYSCSDEYVGICQHKLTREKVIKEVEHNLIHPVGRSHNWVHHEGLGYHPVWEIRECIDYEVRSIQQVRALTCLHMGVSMAWNSCMGHTQYERTLGLTLKQDEFPEVYIRVTEDAWDSIREQGYLNLRETQYSKGLNDPDVRDQYEEKAFNSIVCPSYGYRDQANSSEWAQYGSVVLRLDADYYKFCTSTPGDSLDRFFGDEVLPLSQTVRKGYWYGQEVQIHTFLPPQALERIH